MVRRTAPLVASGALALVLATPGGSAPRLRESESVLLEHGRGYAELRGRGAVYGSVGQGRVRVLSRAEGASPRGYVRGCERRSGRLSSSLRCSGKNLRFFLFGGRWELRTRGKGIVGRGEVRGSLGLDRRRCRSCTYRIGAGSERRWPAALTYFTLRG